MDIAASGGHAILNHRGCPIYISRRVLQSLDRRGYLKRDRKSGLLQFKPWLVTMFNQLEYGNPLHQAVGHDISGTNAVICRCRFCQSRASEVDQTMTPEMTAIARKVAADDALKAIRRARRQARRT